MKKYLFITTCLLAGNVIAMEPISKKTKTEADELERSAYAEATADRQEEVRIDIPAPTEAEKKEEELFQRMAAMRLDQARREEQRKDQEKWDDFDKRAAKMREERTASVSSKQGNGWEETTIDFGPEGISVEDFVALLRGSQKEAPETNEKSPCFIMDNTITSEYIQQNKDEGYRVRQEPDGLTVFYQPEYESEVPEALAAYRKYVKR